MTLPKVAFIGTGGIIASLGATRIFAPYWQAAEKGTQGSEGPLIP